MSHAHANRRDFSFFNPNTGQSFATLRFNFDPGQKFDHQSFNPAKIFVQILSAIAQIDNRITDQLSGSVVGRLPATIDLKKWMRQMRSTAQARLVRCPTDGVNGVMFEEQDGVGERWFASYLRHDFFLQRQGVGKIRSAEPARHDSLPRVMDPRKRVPPKMIKLDTHICAAPGIPNRAVSWARR